MGTAVSYTLPIYNAVVSNLALQNLRQEAEEEQEKVLAMTLESVTLSKAVLKLMGEGNFSTTSKESITTIFVALCILVDTCRNALVTTRAQLPRICEEYQSALAIALDDFESSTLRFEEICAAWGLAYDESAVAEIKQALPERKRGAQGDTGMEKNPCRAFALILQTRVLAAPERGPQGFNRTSIRAAKLRRTAHMADPVVPPNCPLPPRL